MKDRNIRRAFESGPESTETLGQVSSGGDRPRQSGSHLNRALLVMLILALALALMPSLTPEAGAAVDVGYWGPRFEAGPDPIPNADLPTALTPQSKLWFNDGSWWGVLYKLPASTSDAGGYRIHRLAVPNQQWIDTGVTVDPRRFSLADVLWDGSHLYIATAMQPGKGATDLNARLLRFSYNGASYSLDQGFPAVLAQVEMQAIVLDKDSTGILWVTYTAGNGQGSRSVYVSHSTTSDAAWSAPYVIPVKGASNLSTYEISSLIAYDGKIGVMWSNHADNTIYFANHLDGALDDQWTLSTAYRPGAYESVNTYPQFNLKSLPGDSAGRVFAAVSKGYGTSLLILDGNGSWSHHQVTPSWNNPPQFNPIVIVDNEQRKLYVVSMEFAGWISGIYYSESTLDNISFGPSTRFGSDPGYEEFLDKPTSKKGSVNGTTGLVILASDPYYGNYWHNTMGLPGPAPTATTVPPTSTSVPPTATSVPPTATSVPSTATTVPPTATGVPPTATSVPSTATSVPPTSTTVPPTSTPSGPTATAVPPTATGVPPTPTTAPTVAPTPTPKGNGWWRRNQ